jgi:hypothetical protein
MEKKNQVADFWGWAGKTEERKAIELHPIPNYMN